MSPVTFVRPTVWTLRAKIVGSVVALFVVVTLATGAATVLFSRDYLLHQLDADVINASQRMDSVHPYPTYGPGGPNGEDPSGRAADEVLRVAIAGGKVLYDQRGNPVNQVVNENNKSTTLTAAQVQIIQNAHLGTRLQTVRLGGAVGTYRLKAVAVRRSTALLPRWSWDSRPRVSTTRHAAWRGSSAAAPWPAWCSSAQAERCSSGATSSHWNGSRPPPDASRT